MGGSVILPLVLDHYPDASNLNKPAIPGRDSINNTEQIRLDYPRAGNYSIRVKAGLLTGNKQGFALAIQMDSADQVRFTYPLKGDVLTPGRANTLRWESSDTTKADLYYRSPDKDWELIQPGIDLRKEQFSWPVPVSINQLEFRLSTASRHYISDTITANLETRLFTGFNCEDSFLIYWHPVPEASAYQVYTVGSTKLEPFLRTADTLLIQAKKDNHRTHFTVAPVFDFSREGKKAYAFAYQNQQTDCYINNFLADANGTGSARLQLEIGSNYQVSAVRFEQATSTGISTLQILPVATEPVYTITTPASDGLNLYRAVLQLSNGKEYTTRWESVFQFNTSDFYVFPSPVRRGSPITILSKNPDENFLILTDMTGRQLVQLRLTETVQSITTHTLPAGLYIYHIYKNKRRIKTGRLVIH